MSLRKRVAGWDADFVFETVARESGSADLVAAKRLLQNGLMFRGHRSYDNLAKNGELKPADVAKVVLGRAESLASQGDLDGAADALKAGLEGPNQANPDLLARLAELRVRQGDGRCCKPKLYCMPKKPTFILNICQKLIFRKLFFSC